MRSTKKPSDVAVDAPSSEYDQRCHEAASTARVLGITWRSMKLLATHPLTMGVGCLKWNHPESYRLHCCATELTKACHGIGAENRTLLGWPSSCAPHASHNLKAIRRRHAHPHAAARNASEEAAEGGEAEAAQELIKSLIEAAERLALATLPEQMAYTDA